MKLIFKPFVWFFSLFRTKKSNQKLFAEESSRNNNSFGKVVLAEKNVHHEIYDETIQNAERPAIPNSELEVQPTKNKRGYNVEELKGLNLRIKFKIGNKEYRLTSKQIALYVIIKSNPYLTKNVITQIYLKELGKVYKESQKHICQTTLKALVKKNLVRKTFDGKFVVTEPKLGLFPSVKNK